MQFKSGLTLLMLMMLFEATATKPISVGLDLITWL